MEVAICHFCEHHGPSVIFHTRLVTETDSYTSSQLSTPPAPICCTACNPFGNDHPGYTSNEATSNKSTISSNRYTSDIVKNQLQQACFRSLSSEVSPSKEGPIFFSDSGIDIHVISHTFFLKDSSARGFQRWFSVIALANESAILLKLWNTLVPEMKEIIKDLQQMAAEVYKREEEQCSHRMLRSNFHIANVGAARSLQDISGNPAILLKLHIQFSRLILLANCTPNQVIKSKVVEATTNKIEDSVAALIKICEEIGPHFKAFARHILKGGSTSISSDDLCVKESCISALQYLVPVQASKNFIIAQHTLQTTSQPCLLISNKGHSITCILNNCEGYNKASCIVNRLENILLAEDVSPSFIHKQITNIREQLLFAAKKMQELKNADQNKVLQFFQSFGYDTGDLDIFHHWSLYC
ncbi:folliculin-like isoform X1 [Daphnia pulex]|uniref:folliculin-like isoform X1 n=1 Tax=Daphnia pulex TaxID=6669 RepID=UPI001EE0CE05|nr:folliculin-like isoform X1 [Daphnia pulex]